MPQTTQKSLVTYALPYANGSIHIGHMVGFVQTDIWVRFQKMQQQECYFICGDDAHGTPIMISANQRGLTPEQLIQQMQQEHQKDLADFHIEFDNYYTTHSPENRELAGMIYERLVQHGDIVKRIIRQAFD